MIRSCGSSDARSGPTRRGSCEVHARVAGVVDDVEDAVAVRVVRVRAVDPARAPVVRAAAARRLFRRTLRRRSVIAPASFHLMPESSTAIVTSGRPVVMFHAVFGVGRDVGGRVAADAAELLRVGAHRCVLGHGRRVAVGAAARVGLGRRRHLPAAAVDLVRHGPRRDMIGVGERGGCGRGAGGAQERGDVRWYSLLTDTEDRTQALARLQQMQSDFAHINRVSMMGELAASLSHEIAQPIASARNNARAAQNL